MNNDPEQIPEGEDAEVAELLSNLPTETATQVLTPSRGLPYFGKERKLSVRPMTFADEKAIVSTKRNARVDSASLLISRCVEGVEVSDLLIVDKLFLLLKIRELSYGDDYKAQAICTRCAAQNTLNIQLSELTCIFADPEENLSSRKITLPGIKKDAVVMTTTILDEEYLKEDNILSNIWRFVHSIGGNETKAVIAKVVEKLPISDVHTLLKEINLLNYGIQTEVTFDCEGCSNPNIISLPINENFFSVN
tara:strand:+ start:954 stop:1703 length:750 start_codon:yes stop_codon:yes gene_type:complete